MTRPPPHPDRAALILAWLTLGLCLAHALGLVGCKPPPAPRLVAAPSHPIPGHCVQALTRDAELVVLCARTRATCERAARMGRGWAGRSIGLTVSTCYRRPVITIEEVRP